MAGGARLLCSSGARRSLYSLAGGGKIRGGHGSWCRGAETAGRDVSAEGCAGPLQWGGGAFLTPPGTFLCEFSCGEGSQKHYHHPCLWMGGIGSVGRRSTKGHCRAVVDLGAAPSLLPWCFALGIEDGLQWLCPKCFSAVLVNQAESLL